MQVFPAFSIPGKWLVLRRKLVARTYVSITRCVVTLAAYVKDLQRLQQQLMAELKRTGGPRAYGRGEIFESYPYGGRASLSLKVPFGLSKLRLCSE